jgi:redox-sensitive bicupin YhaK (pirin superfamily)
MSGADPLSELKPAMSTSDVQHIETRDSVLGEDLMIRRALPSRLRRTVGAWCFFDHFGPVDTSGGRGMRVGPHPHIGLQTFTWPIAGEILHRDSLGYEQVIRPGAVNLMTAGRGISHSEESPEPRSPILHGAQLWIALPEAQRRMAPSFEHYPSVPALERDGFKLTILVGELLGERSPVRVHTPMVGLELLTQDAAHSVLPRRRAAGRRRNAAAGHAAVSAAGPRAGCHRHPCCGAHAADRRRAVPRGASDLVEFRGAHAAGDRAGDTGLERRQGLFRQRAGL